MLIGLAGVPSWPFLAVEAVVILIYRMSFVLSVVRHHDHQFKSILLLAVHLIVIRHCEHQLESSLLHVVRLRCRHHCEHRDRSDRVASAYTSHNSRCIRSVENNIACRVLCRVFSG